VYAVDVSSDALELAKANAARHGVTELIRFCEGDLGTPLTGPFHVIVANLPYIRSGDLDNRQPELACEPRSALDGGEDGMRYVGPLIDDLPRLLASPGIALLEIDPPIATAARERAGRAFRGSGPGRRATVTTRIEVLRDLAGLERVLLLRQ
jgi:release factor glutamine methyltransferase